MPFEARTINKTRIETFYAALNARDVDAVFDCYGPGAVIEVLDSGPFGGKHDASRELLEAFFGAFRELRFTLLGVTEEDDRLAAELKSVGAFADGTRYANRYHNLFELRDGKIVRFCEYPTGYRGD